ncbi:Tsf1 [Drosophila busckii]|uniref:Transferrin n=1 Tax=Drosophila busckii TaxID=30019 RepID=A0A0M4EU20_DROBS|nr:transferrin [Drosophila busckii]ALC49176.1 Tsf1 [Drosophila busckii]
MASTTTGILPLAATLLLLLHCSSAAEEPIYRMCVPQIYFNDCTNLLNDPSEAGIKMECVAGRDRVECLELIEQRKADVLASEPEDMYMAYHRKNEDYRVISEIRSQDDKDADFRYEGIILVKKTSPIKSLESLRGAKSCHTGFGRNVGYRIPITKLKNTNVLKVSADPQISATERELKSLSEFFKESCLVGNYSAHPESDRLLKKKYSNLCALCEKPAQCNYPDKYSGYDGAIRCLDKGQGEVAFTKVQYIKKYFGLTGKPEAPAAEGKPEDFEYLCEDGTRRPITGAACSWAQRPWSGYISNEQAVHGPEQLHKLQARLERFFENGLHAQNQAAAAHLLIQPNAFYHSKQQAIDPKVYLERAGYKDVIERDGSAIRKLRFCTQTDAEFSKCQAMHNAAYARDARPELECVQLTDCMVAMGNSKADMMIVHASNYAEARNQKLIPLVYEQLRPEQLLVAVAPAKMDREALQKAPIHYDAHSERARFSAALMNKRRSLDWCNMTPSAEKQLQIVPATELNAFRDWQLVCPTMERRPVTDFVNCNVEVQLPRAIFARADTTTVEQETIKHLFSLISERFGAHGKFMDVFALFAPYQKDQENVLFDDNGAELVTQLKSDYQNEHIYNELHCDANKIAKQ